MGSGDVVGLWSFNAFWSVVADTIGIDPDDLGRPIEPDDQLSDDLQLDSLQIAQLILFLDDLGCEVPEDLAPALERADDVYAHYVTRSRAEAEVRA